MNRHFRRLALGLVAFATVAYTHISPQVTMAADKSPEVNVEQLSTIIELPDPFLLSDGSRVKTTGDWKRRREQIAAMVLDYEYGHLPPVPPDMKVDADPIREDAGARHMRIVVRIGGDKVAVPVDLTLPSGEKRYPLIIKGDGCWGPVKPEIVADIIKRGYALAEFDRTAFAPDDAKTYRAKGVYAVYPEADGGNIAAWAWGYSRVIDALIDRDFVDKEKIIVTGHSRGGKAALLAGALDERVALTVPNGSGAGGAGCYRVQPPKTEDLERIVTHFPNWFGPNFHTFIGHVSRLPIDQHEVRALVAPRALLTTEGRGDIWANGPGTQATYLAAKEVYTFLGVPEKIGIHFRDGQHDQLAEDFTALMDFADHVLLKKPAAQDFAKLEFPAEAKAYHWPTPVQEK